MTEPTTFRLDQAEDALPEREGDFLLPLCSDKPEVMLGREIAVLVFNTELGQRVGVPIRHQAMSDLRELLTEALRMLQAGDGDAVQ